MQPELAAHADRWRAIMPLTRPKAFTNLPDNMHPRFVDDLYPLSVADVYTRTYKALINFDVPGNLKHDALVMLGRGHDLHFLSLSLPAYNWTKTDYRRARVWDQVDLTRSAKVAHSTYTGAFRYLLVVGIFLAAPSRDLTVPYKEKLDEMLAILERKAELPQLCANLVTAAEPYAKKR